MSLATNLPLLIGGAIFLNSICKPLLAKGAARWKVAVTALGVVLMLGSWPLFQVLDHSGHPDLTIAALACFFIGGGLMLVGIFAAERPRRQPSGHT